MQPATLNRIFTILLRTLTHYEVYGRQHVPPQGTACILATNHLSRIDTPLLMVAVPRGDIIALVTDKYKSNKLFAFIVDTTGSIWLDRDKADFTAFRAAQDHLRKGGILGIAPEGTRSQNGQLLPGKPGAILLAEKTGVPIVPVGIAGTEDAMHKLRHLRRPHLTVRFGQPFQLPPIDRSDREGSLQRSTDEVMCRIAALLPAQYHGHYAGHSRLQELLDQTEPAT